MIFFCTPKMKDWTVWYWWSGSNSNGIVEWNTGLTLSLSLLKHLYLRGHGCIVCCVLRSCVEGHMHNIKIRGNAFVVKGLCTSLAYMSVERN